jgi:hypothetical protein
VGVQAEGISGGAGVFPVYSKNLYLFAARRRRERAIGNESDGPRHIEHECAGAVVGSERLNDSRFLAAEFKSEQLAVIVLESGVQALMQDGIQDGASGLSFDDYYVAPVWPLAGHTQKEISKVAVAQVLDRVIQPDNHGNTRGLRESGTRDKNEDHPYSGVGFHRIKR